MNVNKKICRSFSFLGISEKKHLKKSMAKLQHYVTKSTYYCFNTVCNVWIVQIEYNGHHGATMKGDPPDLKFC